MYGVSGSSHLTRRLPLPPGSSIPVHVRRDPDQQRGGRSGTRSRCTRRQQVRASATGPVGRRNSASWSASLRWSASMCAPLWCATRHASSSRPRPRRCRWGCRRRGPRGEVRAAQCLPVELGQLVLPCWTAAAWFVMMAPSWTLSGWRGQTIGLPRPGHRRTRGQGRSAPVSFSARAIVAVDSARARSSSYLARTVAATTLSVRPRSTGPSNTELSSIPSPHRRVGGRA